VSVGRTPAIDDEPDVKKLLTQDVSTLCLLA
jgi:hypothetical protein